MAESIGLVLLLSFVAAEEYSIIKALNDLLWIPQSEEEQNEDFNQTTDSMIAIVTALLLMLIAFIGVALAKRVWAFVKSIPGRFKPKPKVVEPEPCAAEARGTGLYESKQTRYLSKVYRGEGFPGRPDDETCQSV